MSNKAAGQQRAAEMLWLTFGAAVMLAIFICVPGTRCTNTSYQILEHTITYKHCGLSRIRNLRRFQCFSFHYTVRRRGASALMLRPCVHHRWTALFSFHTGTAPEQTWDQSECFRILLRRFPVCESFKCKRRRNCNVKSGAELLNYHEMEIMQ